MMRRMRSCEWAGEWRGWVDDVVWIVVAESLGLSKLETAVRKIE